MKESKRALGGPSEAIETNSLGSRHHLAQRRCSRCLPSPVRQKERANVGHGWSRSPKLRQRHDVLEGDVRLGADVRHAHVPRRPLRCGSGRGPPGDLDHDGVPSDGLRHRPLMVDFGELPRVHLQGGEILLFRLRHLHRLPATVSAKRAAVGEEKWEQISLIAPLGPSV